MMTFVSLLPCPLLTALAAIFIKRAGVLTRVAACLMWAQFTVAVWQWAPTLLMRSGAPQGVVRHGFSVDSLSALFILLTTLVVAAAMTHAVGFFDRDMKSEHAPTSHEIAQFVFFVPLFMLAMYCVASADNLGYMWIGMEATTLLSAPLVYFHRTSTSLEATWKYVIICSVGIAFAFFGTAMLYAASQQPATLPDGSLSLAVLTQHARQLPPGSVRVAYVFILLGYGTKAGIFPLHSWLPDAHSEAPAPASAMLSGALLNCALVAIWRVSDLAVAAGQTRLVHQTLLPMAVATVLAAALFLLKQHDIKRLLAYSSMENVGVIACAIALGSRSGFALQAVNHSLIKVALFLVAGNLLQQYGTKKIRELRGLLVSQPAQGAILFALVAAVAGTPPFGSFLSEWQILTTAADARQAAVVIIMSAALALAFIALSVQAGDVLFGRRTLKQSQSVTSETEACLPQPLSPPRKGEKEGVSTLTMVGIPAFLMLLSLLMGLESSPHILALAGGAAR